MTIIGYGRVSDTDQNIETQHTMLTEAGCTEFYTEKVTGKNMERPELMAMLAFIRKDDLVVITKIDRLARSTPDLLKIAEQIQAKGAGLKILNMEIDTSTASGKFTLTIFAGVAQFERELMLERQKEGIKQAKAEDKKLGVNRWAGRKPTEQAVFDNIESMRDGGLSVAKACEQANISVRTYYNHKAA